MRVAIVKEFIMLSNSKENKKKKITNNNFRPYSKELIIKLYFILCRPINTSFRNSTKPDNKIKGMENKKREANSGLPISSANGLWIKKNRIVI